MLLSRMIGELLDITQQNFGDTGVDRPESWPQLSQKYADEFHGGDTTPTLMLDDEKHALRNPNLPHLIDCFRVMVNDSKAELTNMSPYADTHQLGYGVKRRPYYPVMPDGENLTPYAEQKMVEIVEEHFKT